MGVLTKLITKSYKIADNILETGDAVRAGTNIKANKEKLLKLKAQLATLKKSEAFKKEVKEFDGSDEAKLKAEADTLNQSVKNESNELERDRNAVGAINNRTTPNKGVKETVGSMVAYLSLSRGKAIAKAGRDLRADKITQRHHDAVVKAIDEKNAAEVKPIQKPSKKPVSLSRMTNTDDKNLYKGGMTTSKPRTGNTDYRMGGMFMKKGKK